jgi:ubiquinone/menaquinone biosynthesis C-methylase UbiE
MIKFLVIFITFNPIHAIKLPTKYYYNSRIHNFGNVGLGGQIHSLLAPYATTMIDNKCYNSVNIRQLILSKYNQEFYKNHEKLPKIIDLCCGTGTSTATNQLGIDTSEPMISEAKLSQAKLSQAKLSQAKLSQAKLSQAKINKQQSLKTHTKFIIGNAENYGQEDEFDTATIMFAFHEMPNYAHHKIIKNAKKITKHDIIIVDISPNYSPSKLMLSGEPYLLNYKATIHELLTQHQFTYLEYIPNHVGLWVYSHKNNHIFLINNLYHK